MASELEKSTTELKHKAKGEKFGNLRIVLTKDNEQAIRVIGKEEPEDDYYSFDPALAKKNALIN